MKKLLYLAVAAIAALSSCSNDDVIVNENENHKVEAPVFTATIEGEATTRTQLATGSADNKKKVEWLSNDKVFIGGFAFKEVEGTTVFDKTVVLGEYSVAPGSPATTATLNPGSELKYQGSGTPTLTYGVYPASISKFTTLSSEQIASYANNSMLMQIMGALILPATQTYKEADISGIAPMLGMAQGSTELQFSNLTALLAITVPSSEMNSVQKITVSSDKRLNGKFDTNPEEGAWVLVPYPDATDAEKTLTLDCTNNSANTTIPAEGTTFYVSIPPQAYGYLQIDVTDGNGNTKTMKTKNGASISVERNKIYPITFEENQTPRLKIKVTSDDITELKAIKVVTDQIISGTTSKELVYDVPEAQQSPAADGTVYSINIPAKTYEYYKIYLSADGTTYKEAMASKGTVGTISGPVNIDYEKNAVQLWAGGPYFATMNVGETTVGGNTKKYAWGATSADGAPNAKSNNDADTYDLDHDTAYKIWGSAWRMPTQEEFEKMSSNCNLDYNSGFIFKGKNGYSSAKVSFPKDSNQIIAQYWTSSVDGGGNVYHGSFQQSPGNTSFYIGASKPKDTNQNVLKYFVRAVLQ